MADKIKGGFDELAEESNFTIEIDGKELALDLRVEDLHPLITMASKDEPGEEDLDKLSNSLRSALQRTYVPHWDASRGKPRTDLSEAKQKENDDAVKKVESILRNHYIDLVQGIVANLGWEDQAEGTVQQGKNLIPDQ